MVVACAANRGGLTVLVPAQGRCGNSYVYLWSFWWGRLAAGHKIIEKHRSEKWVDVLSHRYSSSCWLADKMIAIGDVRSAILSPPTALVLNDLCCLLSPAVQ